MQEIKHITTKTYKVNNNYYIDVTIKNNLISAYIYHNNYGVKELIFAMDNKYISYDAFIELIELNLRCAIALYEDKYL